MKKRKSSIQTNLFSKCVDSLVYTIILKLPYHPTLPTLLLLPHCLPSDKHNRSNYHNLTLPILHAQSSDSFSHVYLILSQKCELKFITHNSKEDTYTAPSTQSLLLTNTTQGQSSYTVINSKCCTQKTNSDAKINFTHCYRFVN